MKIRRSAANQAVRDPSRALAHSVLGWAPAAVRPPEEWAAAANLVAGPGCLDRRGALRADPDAHLVSTVQKSESCFPFKKMAAGAALFYSLPAAFSRVAVPSSLEASFEPAAVDPVSPTPAVA